MRSVEFERFAVEVPHAVYAAVGGDVSGLMHIGIEGEGGS